jgi:hypothetical protein
MTDEEKALLLHVAGCPRSLAFGDLGDHEPHASE